jgi:hypothetical protein
MKAAEVRLVLSALIPKIESCQQSLLSFDVGSLLYGLSCMKSDCEEVLQILSLLTSKIRASNDKLQPADLSNALFGLRNMSCGQKVVLELVSVLADKADVCGQQSFTSAEQVRVFNTVPTTQRLPSC